MRNTEDNWKRHFKSEIVLQQRCHPVSNWARPEKWWKTSDPTWLQKILCTLLLETFMNKSGNEAPVGSQAFSQRWTETKKSCRHYLSYQDLQHCRPRGTAWPTACLGKCWGNGTSWLHSFLSSRSQEAPNRQLLLLSMSLDMKNATGLNSSTTSI